MYLHTQIGLSFHVYMCTCVSMYVRTCVCSHIGRKINIHIYRRACWPYVDACAYPSIHTHTYGYRRVQCYCVNIGLSGKCIRLHSFMHVCACLCLQRCLDLCVDVYTHMHTCTCVLCIAIYPYIYICWKVDPDAEIFHVYAYLDICAYNNRT